MGLVVLSDFRDRLGNARDQGVRPTCLAFALSDAHAGLREGRIPLSCEFLIYETLRSTGVDETEGLPLGSTLAVLKDVGQPLESVWPYESSTTPPWLENSSEHSIRMYRRNSTVLDPDVDRIQQCSAEGKFPIVTFFLSGDFYSGWNPQGILNLSKEPDLSTLHAMVAVGHGRIGTNELILLRNSWGSKWGMDGYCWVTEDYLRESVVNIVELREDLTDAPID